MKPKLNKNATKWVKALRSGKYRKAIGQLKKGRGFCCLGVACDLYLKEKGKKWERNFLGKWTADGDASQLTKKIKNWLGLATTYGGYKAGSSIVIDNDSNKKRLKEMATIIEGKPIGLFARGK